MSRTTKENFERRHFDFVSFFCTGLTGLATALIVAILLLIIGNVVYHGWQTFSWRFVSGNTDKDMFDVQHAGIFPMIFGTAARVIVMTVFVVPVGVITAIYLVEYAPAGSSLTRIIRSAVNNLAGVPSIVFGLFGLGFFINFVGQHLDQ